MVYFENIKALWHLSNQPLFVYARMNKVIVIYNKLV